jgi:hypothetical protein
MAKESSSGLINLLMKVIFSKITFMEMASTVGQMAVFTEGSGLTIKWRGKAPLLGVMVASTLAAMKMIRSMAMEHLSGQMVASILETGVRVSNMGMEPILRKERGVRVFGRWASALSGLKAQQLEMREFGRKA